MDLASSRRRRFAPSSRRSALALVAFVVVVPELLTGSTPLPAFLDPFLLLFLILGYGAPVLLIREWGVRRRIGLSGRLLCGVAYGIFNEGVLAKTILLKTHVPIPQFDGYGYAWGIGWPWMTFISVWHACASVVFPIAIIHSLHPTTRRRPWLRPGFAGALAVAVVVLGGLVHFSDTRPDVVVDSPFPFLAFVLLAAGLLASASFLQERRHDEDAAPPPSGKAAVLGVGVIVPFAGLSSLAGAGANPAVFHGCFGATVAVFGWVLRRNRWSSPPAFPRFAVGWYFQTAAISLMTMLGNPPLAVASAVADALILVLLWRSTGRPRVKDGSEGRM